MQTRLLPGSSEHIPAGEKACPRAHLTPWLTEQSVAALVVIPQNWSKLLCTSLPLPWPECAGANRERRKGDENVVIINTCPCESSEPWWLHQNESECPSFETVWAEPLFELLPLHSSWLYSDQMHNVNTEESLLLPSTSCANVKGCYEALWIKEIVLSCIQILSTCVCLPSLKLSFRMKMKNICDLSIGFKEINTYAELHMKLGPLH